MSRRGRPRDLGRQGTVHLNIENLVLRGIPRGDVEVLTAALQSELARLAALLGPFFAAANVERVAPIHFTPGTGADQTGRAIASALWSGALTAGGKL